MPEKFDIYSKIFYMDVEKFVRHMCRLVLRHQMPVWNYFVNSFYSVALRIQIGNRRIFGALATPLAQVVANRILYKLDKGGSLEP
jgi:hypothetical protein